MHTYSYARFEFEKKKSKTELKNRKRVSMIYGVPSKIVLKLDFYME